MDTRPAEQDPAGPGDREPGRLREGSAMVASGEVIAREVVVHGRVQGVVYRGHCYEEAQTYGVRGWVTNEPDGTVHAWFEGSPSAVEHMVLWAWQGSPWSKVHHVDVRTVEPRGLSGFGVS